MTKFVDIEIGADIGQIRLYTTDEDYETYGSEDILNLVNNLSKENEQLKQQVAIVISNYWSLKGMFR